MSTEKADSLRTPHLDRPVDDETTVHADRLPALNRPDGDETTIQADRLPALKRESGDSNPLNFNNESNINIAVHDV